LIQRGLRGSDEPQSARAIFSDPLFYDFSGIVQWNPVSPPTPDSGSVVFATPLPSANYVVVYGGSKLDGWQDESGENIYNIEMEGKTKHPTKTVNGFTVDLTWTAYNAATNAWVGSWDNYTAMCNALSLDPNVGLVMTVDWRVVWAQ